MKKEKKIKLKGSSFFDKRKPINKEERNPLLNVYERAISDKVGNKVKITKNKMEISYDSVKDLERIMEIFNISLGDDE